MSNNNNSNCNSGSRFMSGFLWGAIIGGGLVFLLGTKKGKRIIKTLSEEGLELSELLGGEEEEEIEEIIVPSKNKTQNSKTAEAVESQSEDPMFRSEQDLEGTPKTNGVQKTGTISKIASAPRRFFRGIPKR